MERLVGGSYWSIVHRERTFESHRRILSLRFYIFFYNGVGRDWPKGSLHLEENYFVQFTTTVLNGDIVAKEIAQRELFEQEKLSTQ